MPRCVVSLLVLMALAGCGGGGEAPPQPPPPPPPSPVLNGSYVISANGYEGASSSPENFELYAEAQFDSSGNTAGSGTIREQSPTTPTRDVSFTFTGSCSNLANGFCDLVLTPSIAIFASMSGPLKLRMLAISKEEAYLVSNQPNVWLYGELRTQNLPTNANWFAGPWVFKSGTLGRFDLDSIGTVSNGAQLDGSPVAGNYDNVAKILTLTLDGITAQFKIFAISDSRMELMSADGNAPSGFALRQAGSPIAATLNGTYVFEITGQLYPAPIANNGRFYYAQIGLIATTSSGTLTGDSWDNLNGQTFFGGGSYKVNPDGHVVLTLTSNYQVLYTGYVVDQNHLLLGDWRVDALGGGPPQLFGSGDAFIQSGAPFAASALSGDFGFVTREYKGLGVVLSSISAQSTTGVADVLSDSGGLAVGIPVTNTPWSLAPSGGATVSISGLGSPYHLYAVSPSRAFVVNSDLLPPSYGIVAKRD